MKPGIYDLTIEQYHNGPGISRSGIEAFKKSPLHYWHEYLNPDKEPEDKPEIITKQNALEFGNALHSYILEPQEFDKRYMVFEKGDGRTKEGKAANELAKSLQNGRQLLCTKAFKQILDMERSLNNHPTAKNLISGGVYEKSLFWIDSDTGILCKARPDIWLSNMIGDLKTTRSAAYKDFQRDIYGYGYHIQAGMISEALWALQGVNMMNFIYVPLEKEAPYASAVYKLDENAVNKGREEFKKILFEIKECMLSDTWPSYSDATIDLPAYAYNNKEEI
jgi:exodeoxyribonuclease VIII